MILAMREISISWTAHRLAAARARAMFSIPMHGMEGVKFWTKVKTVTQRWPDGGATGDSAFVIPTMG